MSNESTGVNLTINGVESFIDGYTKATRAQDSFADATTKAAGQVDQFKQATQALKLERLTQQIENQKRTLALYTSQLDATREKFGANSSQAQALENRIAALDGKIKLSEKSLDLETQKLGAMEAAEADAGKATASLASNLGQLDNKAKEGSKGLDFIREAAVGATRKLGELAVEGVQKVTSSIGGLAVDTVKVAADFESTLGRFSAVAGPLETSGQTLEDFRQKFLQLGKDTQFSASEAAGAAVELAKGGVEVADIMGEATQATLDLASAAELGLAPAAEIVAKQLAVWGDEAGGAANVANLFSQAAAASTVNADDLALGLNNVGGAARAAGLTFEETIRAVAGISAGFAGASEAGTALNQLLPKLQPSTKGAREAFAELGLLTERGTSAFYDQQGAFIGVTEASRLLTEATKDLNDADQIRLLQAAFGVEAGRAAIGLARLGVEGNEKLTAAMTAQGDAADQGARKNQGFNFALEQLKGSLETAQIVLGTKFLPLGTKIINEFLIPAANGLITLGENIGKVGEFIQTYGLPALTGLAAGAAAYALAVGGATLATYPFAIALQVVVGQSLAAVGAFAAMAIPIAAIAVSIGAITLGIQNYNEQVRTAEQETLKLAKGYQASAIALEEYKKVGDTSGLSAKNRVALESERLIVERLRQQLEYATEQYYAVGSDSAKWEQEIYRLNGELSTHSTKLTTVSKDTAKLAADNEKNQKAMELSRMGLVNYALSADEVVAAQEKIAAATKPTGEELDKLLKVLEKLAEQGPGALDKVIQGQNDYISKTEELTAAHEAKVNELTAAGNTEQLRLENESYTAQMNNAAIAYAEQQAAQRAHLGQLLINYAETQAQINGVGIEKTAELTAAIAEEYGVQRSLSDRTFADMTGDIDEWARSGGENSAALAGRLGEATDAAAETQRQMDALAKEYKAELVQNFEDGKIDADQLREALEKIPARVNAEVNVHTTYSQSGNPPPAGSNVRYGGQGGAIEARAEGGPIDSYKPYLVGERGPEFIFPQKPGWVANADLTRAIMQAPRQVTGEIGSSLADNISIGGGSVQSALRRLIDDAMGQARQGGRGIAMAMAGGLHTGMSEAQPVRGGLGEAFTGAMSPISNPVPMAPGWLARPASMPNVGTYQPGGSFTQNISQAQHVTYNGPAPAPEHPAAVYRAMGGYTIPDSWSLMP